MLINTQTIHICLIRWKLKVVSDTKLKAIRDVFSKEAEPKEQSLWRELDLPSLVDIVWYIFGLKFKHTVCNVNTMKLGFKLFLWCECNLTSIQTNYQMYVPSLSQKMSHRHECFVFLMWEGTMAVQSSAWPSNQLWNECKWSVFFNSPDHSTFFLYFLF